MIAVGWILIGFCIFYLIRNFWAGLLYRAANIDVKAVIKISGQNKKSYTIANVMPLRNYYLFVLNPFWWRLSDIFKDKKVRKLVRERAKNLKSFK